MSLTVKGDGDDGNTGHRICQGLDLGEVGFGLGRKLLGREEATCPEEIRSIDTAGDRGGGYKGRESRSLST